MIIKIKKVEILSVDVEEVSVYDVCYLIPNMKGNRTGSEIVTFSNMPTSDDIKDHRPSKFKEDPYDTYISERRLIKTQEGKYIYNYPYSDKEFEPKYYPVTEN